MEEYLIKAIEDLVARGEFKLITIKIDPLRDNGAYVTLLDEDGRIGDYTPEYLIAALIDALEEEVDE